MVSEGFSWKKKEEKLLPQVGSTFYWRPRYKEIWGKPTVAFACPLPFLVGNCISLPVVTGAIISHWHQNPNFWPFNSEGRLEPLLNPLAVSVRLDLLRHPVLGAEQLPGFNSLWCIDSRCFLTQHILLKQSNKSSFYIHMLYQFYSSRGPWLTLWPSINMLIARDHFQVTNSTSALAFVIAIVSNTAK